MSNHHHTHSDPKLNDIDKNIQAGEEMANTRSGLFEAEFIIKTINTIMSATEGNDTTWEQNAFGNGLIKQVFLSIYIFRFIWTGNQP